MLAGKLSATHHRSAGTVTAKIDPMPIPFADGMLSRLGRRGAALDLIEEFEDESGEPPASLSPADLLAAEPALLLQKMENRLVRHHLANPDVLSGEQLRKLRYILNFARLADFEPGAAGPGGSRGRGDISVGGQVAPWRSRVVDALYAPLREEPDPVTALEGAKDVLATLVDDQDDQRRVLIERHGSDFSATELDAEVGYKKLVTVLGGGGGAGFVYIGGMQRLLAAGQVPDYMIGSSFGSIIGSLVARELPVPIDEYAEWAKTVSYRAILGPERRRSRHGLAGMFTLRFDQFAHTLLSRADGERMRMSDLAIPFDVVVAGVRRQPYAALPSRFRHRERSTLTLRSLPFLPIGIGPWVAARMWQVAAFIDLRVVKPIVISADGATRDVNVVDAASFLVGHPRCAAPRNQRPADAANPRRVVRRPGRRGDGRRRRGQQRPGRIGVGAGPRRAARHPQRVLSGVRLLPSALGPPTSVAGTDHPGGPAADGAQPALRRPPRPIRADAVAGEPGAVRGGHRPGLPVGARQRRTGDCGDIGAAGADVVGRRQAPRRRTQGTHKVGGLVDERRDGRDSGADGPVSAMAKPPPDLATATGNATSAVESKPGAQVQQQRFRSPTQSPRTPRC